MSTYQKNVLLTALRFFAYSAERKADYLSAVSAENAVFPSEDEEPFVSPLHAFTAIATDILEKYPATWPDGEGGRQTIRDLVCVLLMMGDLSDQEYFWFLDKESHTTSGPHDGAWMVLARLSEIALTQFGWSKEGPVIDFLEMLRRVEFVIRPKPSRDSES